MTTTKTKDLVTTDENVIDLIVPLCTKVLFGMTLIIGVWGVFCIISGMVAAGGPVALVSALISAV